MSTMSKGRGTGVAAYSFSSQPKPVAATRKKYREPGEEMNTGVFRDLKETSIMWDKRVQRGCTYGLYTQKAIKEAFERESQEFAPAPRGKRQAKEKSVFDLPMPEPERVPVDLTSNLVAKEVVVETHSVEVETDEFLPEPPTPEYVPQKTGIDVQTQVEDGELFVFDYEVEPILDVIVQKTLEQSIMEVEEEHELERMKDFKNQWYQRQQQMAKDWQAQVDDEWQLWHAKERLLREKRAQKQREARVLLKIQAMHLANQNVRDLVPSAVKDLKEVAFPDDKGLAINRIFLPQLLGQVQEQVRANGSAERHVREAISAAHQQWAASHARSLEAQRERHQQEAVRRYEELQQRQGMIRIVVDDGSGGSVVVGPVKISSQDSMEEVQARVFSWLEQREPRLAASLPYGIELCIGGETTKTTLELFEAKAGKISMVPKPAPPPPEPSEDNGEPVGDGEEAEE